MPDSPDPVEKLTRWLRETHEEYRAKLDAAEAALLLCQQELEETHRCWDETNQTIAKYQADLDASASALKDLQQGVEKVVAGLRERARLGFKAHASPTGQCCDYYEAEAYRHVADTLASLLPPASQDEK